MKKIQRSRSYRAVVGGTCAALFVLTAPTAVWAETDEGISTESSVAEPREDRAGTRAARTEARAELRSWLAARKELLSERASAMSAARTELRASLAAATSPEARRAAKDAFKTASLAAKVAYDTAVAGLGPRPVVSRR